ncbi:TetR family transcriptional regulator [Rubrivivax gelatinosus]|nr:TetR family transcriptional regulator [Rubrivivax gelatinosus]
MAVRNPSSPTPRRRRSAEARAEFRQALVDEAKRLLIEHGPDALTIRAVTQPLGASLMAFYTYFDGKQDLLRAVWGEYVCELHQALLAAAPPGTPPLQALRAHVETFIAYWEAHPDFYRIVYHPALTIESTLESARADPVYAEMLELGRRRVAAVVGADVTDPDLLAQAEMMFTKGVGFLHTTIVLRRFPVADCGRLRRLVIDDIVDSLARKRLDADQRPGREPGSTRRRRG